MEENIMSSEEYLKAIKNRDKVVAKQKAIRKERRELLIKDFRKIILEVLGSHPVEVGNNLYSRYEMPDEYTKETETTYTALSRTLEGWRYREDDFEFFGDTQEIAEKIVKRCPLQLYYFLYRIVGRDYPDLIDFI